MMVLSHWRKVKLSFTAFEVTIKWVIQTSANVFQISELEMKALVIRKVYKGKAFYFSIAMGILL